MKQREAVYQATHSVLKDAGISFDDGGNIMSVMTAELRTKIIAIVVSGFQAGTVTFESNANNQAKLAEESKLRSYTSGLVSNWFRKDKRFNGDTKYVAKNPGSRTGIGDKQLKALRSLRTQFASDPAKAAQIDSAIASRTTEIAAAKAKPASVDLTAIPADLLAELGIGTEEAVEEENE
jgi:hypothetical protein